MPIIKSAKKRVRVARKATIRNVKTKRTIKSTLKAFQAAVSGGKGAAEAKSKAQGALDTAAKKKVMHKNKVARKQRQLAAEAKAAGVKPTAKKPAKKAAPAKKPTTAKTKTAATTKKPAAKKAPATKKTTKK